MALPRYSVFALFIAGAIFPLSGVAEPAGRFDFNASGACAGSGRARSCPATCFRPDPVCGVDGVTYWCGCGDAACAGTEVAKLGFCEVAGAGAGAQAMLLLHIVWLIVVGFSVMFGVL